MVCVPHLSRSGMEVASPESDMIESVIIYIHLYSSPRKHGLSPCRQKCVIWHKSASHWETRSVNLVRWGLYLLPPGKILGRYCFWLRLFFYLIFVNALSLEWLSKTQPNFNTRWRRWMAQWALYASQCGHHLEKTLFSQDYESLSMNIKQLLQLKCIALQHISIILL